MTLADLATGAASLWGGTPLVMLRNRENAVFKMALQDGSLAALRLHRQGYQSDAAIRSELWWCTALADQGLPVPRPVATLSGDLLGQTSTGRIASVVQWMPGEPLGEDRIRLPGTVADQCRDHHALGRLLAKIHTATDRLQLPSGFTRPRWDSDGLIGDAPLWGRFWDHPALTANERTAFLTAREFLRAALQSHEASERLGPIHADVLRENVLVNNHSLSLIDFDDSGIGFRQYDLGTAMLHNLDEPHYSEIRAALIDGYATLRTVDPQMVDVFTLARTLASVGWTMPRLAPDDPIMRRHIQRALDCMALVMV